MTKPQTKQVWVVEMQDAFGRWTACADCALSKKECERLIRQYWLPNNPSDKFRAKRYTTPNQ